jgi:hypothetical protein
MSLLPLVTDARAWMTQKCPPVGGTGALCVDCVTHSSGTICLSGGVKYRSCLLKATTLIESPQKGSAPDPSVTCRVHRRPARRERHGQSGSEHSVGGGSMFRIGHGDIHALENLKKHVTWRCPFVMLCSCPRRWAAINQFEACDGYLNDLHLNVDLVNHRGLSKLFWRARTPPCSRPQRPRSGRLEPPITAPFSHSQKTARVQLCTIR